jgi:hypothetical protein
MDTPKTDRHSGLRGFLGGLETEIDAGEAPLGPIELFSATGIEPDDWQRELLLSSWERALLTCSRQSGKSTVTAALALHAALSQRGALVLLLAPARRQSKELLTKIRSLYRGADPAVKVEKWSELRLRFDNEARIVALPGTERTVRGYSADLIAVDEAARVEGELYEAIRPMLGATGGRLVALSTPAGQRGWFYRAWTDETQDWHRTRVTARDCPRLSEEFLRQERREMPDWKFTQEYLCRFTEGRDQYFRSEDIDQALTSDTEPLAIEGLGETTGSPTTGSSSPIVNSDVKTLDVETP